LSGIGGWPGAVVVNNLDTRDKTVAAGWGEAMTDLPKATARGGTLYVFTVEGK
jgi:alcohol dehydrogenase (cytochrome c)